ncbi:MAG: isoprenylcysteine carboxylmethyltransferase family protein [Acidobacteria bacterium]|nr:isoprenylcysteine carboxylmethyltransferase family protein [Acidobacteriota bacterium]
MECKVWLQKWRVPLGFAFALVFFLLSRPDWHLLLVGAPSIVAGLWVRVWAAGHIRKSKEITRSGPYAQSRNPLYLGSFLLGLGFSLQSGLWFFPLLFIILFFAIYLPVMRREEWELQRVFGEEFDRYRQAVALFWPWPGRTIDAAGRFSRRQAVRNREYNSLFGALAAEGILMAKIVFFS